MSLAVDITHTLLEFLLMLVENYDIERKDVIVKGVSSAFVRFFVWFTLNNILSKFAAPARDFEVHAG